MSETNFNLQVIYDILQMEYLNNKLRFKTEVFDGASFLESKIIENVS